MGEHDIESQKQSTKQGYDYLLAFCRFVNILTGTSALLCLVAHAMALCVGPSLAESATLKVQVLRLYGIVFSFVVILLETEWQFFLNLMRLLDNWFVRGLVQAFVAVLTLEIAVADGNTDLDKSVRLYRKVAGIAMISCAGFYIVGGVLCLGLLKEVRYRRLVERQRVERDLEAVEKQREELRGLLAGYGLHD